MPRSVATFLMFTGSAETAMKLYVETFGGEVHEVFREGDKFQRARFSIAGHELVAFDSPAPHAFGFTPSISLFVTCQDEAEVDRAFAALSEGGSVLMPLGAYPFSKRFGWLNDRFGVSWQLSV